MPVRANHRDALSGMTQQEAVVIRIGGRPIAPMAIVTGDGGRVSQNPHPGDHPMAMVIDEVSPMCQRLGLGRPTQRIGTIGVAMRDYGAISLGAEVSAPHLGRGSDQYCDLDQLQPGARGDSGRTPKRKTSPRTTPWPTRTRSPCPVPASRLASM